MISPPSGPAFVAKPMMPCSISVASRTPMGVNSTLDEEAAVWIAAKPPAPAGTEGSRITATCFKPGATSSSKLDHFPPMLNS